MSQKFKILLTVAALFLIGVIVWIIWANTALQLNTYTITSDKLPGEFSGFKIAHVSDLHCSQIGKDNQTLLALLKDAQPDIIAITGDLFDSEKSGTQDESFYFVSQAVNIAPCYYVTGNHEARFTDSDALKERLSSMGVAVLDDSAVEYTLNEESIYILGINDPSYETSYLFGDSATIADSKLKPLANEGYFQLLLSHRPELFDVYCENGMDLVLSGHAHGGQFRLPFIGGLFAPNQGFFPEYDSGLYTNGHTNLIVSRGIGNSRFPFRINNRPEIILIELQPA